MPIKITLTQQDILRGKLCTPGWHRLTAGHPSTQISKKGDSTTYVVPFVVKAGPKTHDGSSPAGIPLTRYYSEKAPGFITKLLKAYGANIDESKQSQSFDLEAIAGKDIEGYVENQLDNNKVMQNQLVDFRPVSGSDRTVEQPKVSA